MRFVAVLCFAMVLATNASAAVPHQVQPKRDTQLCLDVTDQSKQAGARVQVWGCANTENQHWLQQGDALLAYGEGYCLDVVDGVNADGTRVQIWPCTTPNRNQSWQWDSGRWRWKGTDKCLDLTDGHTTNGTPMQIWTCTDNDDNQQFVLASVSTHKSAPSTTAASSSPTTASTSTSTSTSATSTSTSSTAASSATDAGTFAGFAYISLDAFLQKHPELSAYRQDLLDAAQSVSPALPPQLLAAVAMEESSGNPSVSGGLMQFTDAQTWAAYGQGDINNARDSLFAAARYIDALLKQDSEDLSRALTDYNGGANSAYVTQIKSWLSGGFPYGEGT